MCEHLQQTAVVLGYKAMHFKFVASTNESAVHLGCNLGLKLSVDDPSHLITLKKSM